MSKNIVSASIVALSLALWLGSGQLPSSRADGPQTESRSQGPSDLATHQGFDRVRVAVLGSERRTRHVVDHNVDDHVQPTRVRFRRQLTQVCQGAEATVEESKILHAILVVAVVAVLEDRRDPDATEARAGDVVSAQAGGRPQGAGVLSVLARKARLEQRNERTAARGGGSCAASRVAGGSQLGR